MRTLTYTLKSMTQSWTFIWTIDSQKQVFSFSLSLPLAPARKCVCVCVLLWFTLFHYAIFMSTFQTNSLYDCVCMRACQCAYVCMYVWWYVRMYLLLENTGNLYCRQMNALLLSYVAANVCRQIWNAYSFIHTHFPLSSFSFLTSVFIALSLSLSHSHTRTLAHWHALTHSLSIHPAIHLSLSLELN